MVIFEYLPKWLKQYSSKLSFLLNYSLTQLSWRQRESKETLHNCPRKTTHRICKFRLTLCAKLEHFDRFVKTPDLSSQSVCNGIDLPKEFQVDFIINQSKWKYTCSMKWCLNAKWSNSDRTWPTQTHTDTQILFPKYIWSHKSTDFFH